MIRNYNTYIYFLIIIFSVFLYSCSDNSVSTNEQKVILFDSTGLVDSVVVNGCYEQLDMFFTGNLGLEDYLKLKIEFDGMTNSNGTFVQVLYDCDTAEHVSIYRMDNTSGINKKHSFTIDKPSDIINIELRMYIFPPVCGPGEFKYTRVRDLSIYGVKD